MIRAACLFIFMSFLINGSRGQSSNLNCDNYWLIFENFKDTSWRLPDNFHDLKTLDTNVPIVRCMQDMFLKTMKNRKKRAYAIEISLNGWESSYWKKAQKIEDNCLDFLCEQEIIHRYKQFNDRHPEYLDDRTKIIAEIKAYHNFYYLGKIAIDTSFESHLVFACNNKDSSTIFVFREIYLLNVKNNRLLSIAKVCETSSVAFFYTQLKPRKKFHYRGIYYAHDVEYVRWIDRMRYKSREHLHTIYTFDKQGFIDILYNKKEEYE